MAKSEMNATEITNEDALCQDKKELVICVTGYVYSEPRNKENSSVEELDKLAQKSTGLINFIRTKSTRKVKFKDLKEHSDNYSVKALPTYKSLDSLGDEPPRYEVVTGKPLHHEQVICLQNPVKKIFKLKKKNLSLFQNYFKEVLTNFFSKSSSNILVLESR